MEESDLIDIAPEESDAPKGKKVKAPKAKKRPSDFEIIRTLFQRTNERKLPHWLRNMGEDSDLYFLVSENEENFLYGSSEMSICLIEITDESLKQAADQVLGKMKGFDTEDQIVVNIRDQVSELVKTKGESIDVDMETDGHGTYWVTKTDVAGKERTVYYTKRIDSLFHFESVRYWCRKYRPLLSAEGAEHLYYPHTHPDDSGTYSILTFEPDDITRDHPLIQLYPHGFRMNATRGVDVALSKGLAELPYPVVREEMIIFQDGGAACQSAHRMVGEGWRMLILRPNAIMFPHYKTPLPNKDLKSYDL